MKIQILGTGCAKCRKLEANARTALATLGIEAEIVKVTDISKIMEYDVMITPALAIDGNVKVSGRVAGPNDIMDWITKG